MSYQGGAGGQTSGGSQGSGGGSGTSQPGEGGTAEQGGGSGQGAYWFVGQSRTIGGEWTSIDSATDNPSMIALQALYRTMDNQHDYQIIYAGSTSGVVWSLTHGFANGYQNADGSIIVEQHDCPEGQHWDEAKGACMHDVMTCPEGYHWDAEGFNPNSGKNDGYCLDASGNPNCPPGKHWDTASNSCIMDKEVTPGTGGGVDVENSMNAFMVALVVVVIIGLSAYMVAGSE